MNSIIESLLVWAGGAVLCLIYTGTIPESHRYTMPESLIIAIFLWPLVLYDIVKGSRRQYRGAMGG